MDQLSEIIKKKREGLGLNKSQMAKKIGISSQLYGQYEDKKKNPKADFLLKWKQVFNETLLDNFETNVSHETNTAQEPEVQYGEQHIIQVVLNLSFIGKKNAESMDKMAESNLINTRSIATLISLLANSGLSDLSASLQNQQHTDTNLPAEAFLGPGGSDAIRNQRGQTAHKPVKKGT